MIEILRRVILAAGVLIGLWLAAWTPDWLFAVEPIDWSDRIDHKKFIDADAKRLLKGTVPDSMLKDMDLAATARGPIAGFIESETKDRLVHKSSYTWGGFFNAVADASRGTSTDPAWLGRRGRDYYQEKVYFRPDEKPISELVDEFRGEDSFRYVKLTDGSATQWLGVTKVGRSDLMRQAPGKLAYPHRHLGFLVVLLGLLAYALIPWPKVPVESARFSRVNGSTLPDGLAAVVGGLFFVLPILIASSNGAGGGPFSDGWIILTVVFWLFTLLFATIWAASAWYTALSLQAVPNGYKVTTLFKNAAFPTEEIEAVDAYRMDPVKLNRFLVIAAFLVSWRALGPALLASGPHYGLRIKLKDGRWFGFAQRGLLGLPQMLGHFKSRGIAISTETLDVLGIHDKELNAPFPKLGSGIAAGAFLVLFALPLAWLGFATRPMADPAVKDAPLIAKPYASPKSTEFVPTAALMQAEERILAEMRELTAKMKALNADVRSADPAVRQKAVEESQKCLARINELQIEFDRLRKDAGAPD